MLYFTADTHFSHDNIRKYCIRPFLSVEEMDETLLANINKKISKDDTFYVLGDFCFRGKSPKYYLDRIICKNVILIIGNHDSKKQQDLDCFSEVHNYLELDVQVKGCDPKYGKKIILFHYPIQEWNMWHRGSWHLNGHTHANNLWSHNNPNQYILDVGVDAHNYEPLSLNEVATIMEKKTWKNPFDTWESEGKLWKKDRQPEDHGTSIT